MCMCVCVYVYGCVRPICVYGCVYVEILELVIFCITAWVECLCIWVCVYVYG
jgi:hypothetical protein